MNSSILAHLANMQSGASASGEMHFDEVAELNKALTAGYGTDVAALSGGGALRVQSLDKTMQATVQTTKDLTLMSRLAKGKPTATVDEWTEQSSVGGYVGGTTNGETGQIVEEVGQYDRRVGMVKFLMTRRGISFVQSVTKNIADAQAIEYRNGAIKLCTDAEFLMFEGNSAIVATEFDGIGPQLEAGVAAGLMPADHVIDLAGRPLADLRPINQAAAAISSRNNFGTPTDLFLSVSTQADFDNDMDPAARVAVTNAFEGGVRRGNPVVGIRTSAGEVGLNKDKYVRDSTHRTPFQCQFPAVAAMAKNVANTPGALTVTVANNAQSMFDTTAKAGTYYYAVSGRSQSGESVCVVSAAVNIGVGQAATITIPASVSQGEGGYVISRTRVNGGNVVVGGEDGLSDFREMVQVKRTGISTVWVDRNREIPGSTKAFVLNLTPGDTAITWQQLLPMMRFDLYPTDAAVIPWAQLLFGYLRITKLKHHCLIKNIIPDVDKVWRPFRV